MVVVGSDFLERWATVRGYFPESGLGTPVHAPAFHEWIIWIVTLNWEVPVREPS